VFGDDLIISGIRSQTSRLKDILSQMENDEKWKDNRNFYSQRLKDIEKTLRKIRKQDFELIATF
jgi:hypothetical protein